MISVETKDGRKRLGVGFGVERDMDENELEDGEAYSYRKRNDDDLTIDPDVALSYIDDKIQDVLGHHKKDFEVGVSAENLGSKFGGYGSFLPTYQRSLFWSHPSTSPKVPNHNSSSSPNLVHSEVGSSSAMVSSGGSLSERQGLASMNIMSVTGPRLPSMNHSVKEDAFVSFNNASEESNSVCVPLNKSVYPSDQKKLKVRIKVGSGSLSAQKNAEIYSGLGLGVSPSSSLYDSPTDSEGFSYEPRDTPDESPTSILQIMTSFPVKGSRLLSPLPDDFIQLTGKEKLWSESRSGHVHMETPQNSSILANGSNFASREKKIIGEEVEVNNINVNLLNAQNVSVLWKKEADMDTIACEKLVSNALKLPLISNSGSDDVESLGYTAKVVDNPRIAIKRVLKDESSSYLEEKNMETSSTHKIGQAGKPSGKVNSGGKIRKSKKSCEDNLVCTRKEENPSDEKTVVSTKGDHSDTKGRKALSTKLGDPPIKNASQVATSYEENGTTMSEKKSKESQSHRVQDARVSEHVLRFDYFSVHENGKGSDVKSFISKSEKEDLKKDCGKSRDRYRDFWGDLKLGGDNEVASKKMHCSSRIRDLEVVEKGTRELKSTSKGRLNGKKIVWPSASDPKVDPPAGKGHISDAAPVMTVGNVVPLVQEDWVCCDKCQAWRLLPLGTNPDSLPEKWVCSMLDWLPGKNRCSVSEDETTNALRACYQVPAPAHEDQTNRNDCPDKITSKKPSIDDWHPGQDYQMHSVLKGGKKKHRLKDGSNASDLDCCVHALKKDLQGSARIENINGVKHFPSVDELGLQRFGKSSSLVVEKNKHKQKQKKKKALDSCYSGGDMKSTKTRNKRETDQGCPRSSKKTKIDDVHHYGENSRPDHGEPVLKVVNSSSSGFSINVSERKQPKGHVISNNSNCDSKVKVSVSIKNKENWKKRKMNECQKPQILSVPVIRLTHHLQECKNFIEETCENDHMKEKKYRASKSGEKEISGSRGTGKKFRIMKDQQNLCTVHPSLPANSSSSKVSGSHKKNSSLQEVKGSPVESVSSSPLRISNVNFFTSTRRMLEDDKSVSNLSGIIKSDDALNVINHGSFGSSVLDFEDSDLDHISASKAKPEIVPSPCMPWTSHHCHDEEIENGNQYHYNEFPSKTSGKGSSLRSTENNQISGSELDKGKVEISYSSSKSIDHPPSHAKDFKAGRNRLGEKFSVNSDNVEKKIVPKKDSTGKLSSGNCKRESHLSFVGHGGLDMELDASSGEAKHNSLLEPDNEIPPNIFLSNKKDCIEISGKGNSHHLPPPGRMQSELVSRYTEGPEPIPRSRKEDVPNLSPVDAYVGNGALEAVKQMKKIEIQNGHQLINCRHTAPKGQKVRDLDAPSHVRRDSSNQAATNAVKEAKSLKHMADRIKNSGSTESTVLYFQAALKFLHGASLLESCNNEHSKHVEMIQLVQMYSSTAKLCEFCAHEYEKSKDMAAAALAYKCMEVAYMRVIYCSHVGANRDRHELQTTLQLVPPGESPSSSASDVDNLNNQATKDKVVLAKGVSSPQVARNHVITSQIRSSFGRLLNFAQDVNFSVEASRKSRIAFAAAHPGLEETTYSEGISSVKRALDFSFQDVEGLLRLVRLAMEAINR